MSWKPIIVRAESLLGGRAPAFDLSLLGESESTFLVKRASKLASTTDHKIAQVICAQLRSASSSFLKPFMWTGPFSRDKYAPQFPQSMLMPMVGQCILNQSESKFLSLHRKMGEIFAIINLAMTLHRTIVDLSTLPSKSCDSPTWLENLESGNKIAVLSGDILLARASLDLASFRVPKIVEMVSGAIADALRAEFSDIATLSLSSNAEFASPSKLWLEHITLRHGALLGGCCAATVVLNSPSATVSSSLLQSARDFGSAWGCLTRLLAEMKFVNEAQLKIDASGSPKSLTFLGFTESGLPEPTLADVCCTSSEDFAAISDLYSLVLVTSNGDVINSTSEVGVPARKKQGPSRAQLVLLCVSDCVGSKACNPNSKLEACVNTGNGISVFLHGGIQSGLPCNTLGSGSGYLSVGSRRLEVRAGARMRLVLATAICILLGDLDSCNASDKDFKFQSYERTLIKRLLEKYERMGKIGRPVMNNNQTLNVQFGLSLFQLMDLDEADQLFTVNVWNKFAWRDEILTWDPKDYNEVKHVRIPVKHVWTPDIVLLNYADERLEELREVMLTVDYTGQIFWSPPSIYKSMCRIQMEHFPFDHQICYLRFASWTLHGRRLNLTFLDGIKSALLDDYQESNEWHIVAYPAVRRFFRQTCCDEPSPNLIFFFVLKRNPDFYAYLLVLPCILLAVLNLVTFWLPPQNPARMMLGMNILSGFCIQMKFLTLSTPSASNTIPYLGYYYCLNMVLIAIFTFFSLIAVQIHFREDRTKPLPTWLAELVKTSSRWLGLQPGVLCLSSTSHTDENNISRIEMHLAKERRRRRDSFEARGAAAQMPGPCYCQQQQQQQHMLQMQTLTHCQQTPMTAPAMKTAGKQLETSLKEIKRALRNLMHKFNEKDQIARLASDWEAVGMLVDRFCFWVYLILIVVTGMVTLIPPMPYVYERALNDEALIQRFKELANHVESIDNV
ncbi:Neuronal acetylcholine receptor subunit alpha-3 [Taenia crassiceps]|uniref:Neuronal acetylcholine receptor subunit alpha-3 n=1 Tax=Taenia crassiceps TaxID=6207 RepID=A0ABR4Q626_9CEST